MKKHCLFLISVLCLFLCGCAKNTEIPYVDIDGGEATISYSLVSATYDDVLLTQKITCVYVQTEEQEVSFDVSGKYVDKVYVDKGTVVKKGDLLCELSAKSLEESIEDLDYRIKRNELLLSFTDEDEALGIQDIWLNPYSSDENKKESVKRLQDSYELTRQNYNDQLEFDREELNAKKAELKASRVYASMDGIVHKIKDNLEGSTTRAGDVIITIVNNNDCMFKVEGTEYKNLFNKDSVVDMKIVYTNASGDYTLVPKDIDKWDDSLLFSVYTGPENDGIEVGTTGTISAVIDRRDHVISLPKSIVHNAEDKYYVYVVNDDNVREVKWVEIGLVGDTNVEILNGLTEGEKVVKK